MHVIATAGHVDHGKSALVTALTTIDPDRLPEEKRRGMTVDLGFAWLDLGDGRSAGIVDVPGHERFVRHMLAGVGGIDLALLVVAADEAVMPQTREHLAILDLLQVRHGVTALTKRDLVDDEWLLLAGEEVRAALKGTSLEATAIIPCSSRTGQGIEDLRAAIDAALTTAPARLDRGRPRLPIDRVFSITGHGTVVTGTLLDGALETGQEVEIAPGGLRCRIRALQSHHRSLDRVGPGRRVAVNLAGLAVEHLARGMVVCLPGTIPTATYLDLRLRGVREPPHGYDARRALLTHGQSVVLHTGAAEVQGIVRLLDRDALGCGDVGWAQLRLDAPIAARRGDHCVLRVPSPAATVAGGEIVAINPPRRTRKRADTLHALTGLTKATPEERLLDILARQPADTATLAAQADMPRDMVERTLRTLRDAGRVVGLAGERPVARTLWTVPTWLADTTGALLAVLGEYHRRHPLQRGMRGEEARACLGLERAPWNEVAAQGKAIGMIGGEGNLIWAAEHRVVLDPAREAEAMAFLDRLTERPYAPSENGQDLDPELLRVLLDRGDPVCLAPGVLLRRNAYTEMVEAVLREIDEGGMVSVGTLRDRFGTSRKFALALLEHLDDRRLTRRVGDGRVRGSAANR